MDLFLLPRIIIRGRVIFPRWLVWGLATLIPISAWGDLEGRRASGGSPRTFLIAKDSSTKVNRGGGADIEIAAIPNFRNQVIFEIITPPSHGRIGECRPTGDHTASVYYRHDGSRGPVIDQFSFRVKSPGKSPSSPAVCTIQIIPPPPLLALIPETLDFGMGLVGFPLRKNLMLRNNGGREAVGRLALPAGIVAPDGDSFRLEEGESRLIPLDFLPTGEKPYEAQISAIPAFGSGEVRVRGVGKTRFDLIQKNRSEVDVRNLSPGEIRLELNSVDGWEIPKSLVLYGGEVRRIHLMPTRSNQDSKQGDASVLKVSDGFTVHEILLLKPPRYAPPKVTALGSPSKICMEAGVGMTLSFRLSNPGESLRKISWDTHSDNGGGVAPGALELGPGESKDITFQWIPTLPGDAVLKLSVRDKSEEVAHLEWRANIVIHQTTRTCKLPETDVMLTSVPLAMPEWHTSSKQCVEKPIIPPVLGLTSEVCRSWPFSHKVLLSWDGQYKTDSITVEELVAIIQTKLIPDMVIAQEKQLIPCLKSRRLETARFCLKGGTTRCVIDSLSPGWHMCRISLGSPGAPTASSQFAVNIPAVQWGTIMFRIIGFFLLGCFTLYWLRSRNS